MFGIKQDRVVLLAGNYFIVELKLLQENSLVIVQHDYCNLFSELMNCVCFFSGVILTVQPQKPVTIPDFVRVRLTRVLEGSFVISVYQDIILSLQEVVLHVTAIKLEYREMVVTERGVIIVNRMSRDPGATRVSLERRI